MKPGIRQWHSIAEAIEAHCGVRIDAGSAAGVAGGCIHTALRVEGHPTAIFLKLNEAAMEPAFEAEKAGLEALALTNTVSVPRPLGCGVAGKLAWLALEWLELSPGGGGPVQHRLGLDLAALHKASGRQFGFNADNVLGATPQPNGWQPTWPEFLREMRLGFQLDLASHNGFGGELQTSGARLLERLETLPWHVEFSPVLVHGDLWGGNWGALVTGRPVVFDPAVFYGDPESDIAMTELFGGFGPDFYNAYRSVHPEPPDGQLRRDLYRLYHVLNHLNLFGGGYLGQAMDLLRRLLSIPTTRSPTTR